MNNLRPRFLVSGIAVRYHSSGILNVRGVGFITKADLEYSDTVWQNLKRTSCRQPMRARFAVSQHSVDIQIAVNARPAIFLYLDKTIRTGLSVWAI